MLVATDIAARGIDVEALGHVVNFDVPKAPEDYIHRVGRTARAEATGDAFTFVAPDEEEDLRRIEQAIGKRLPRVTVPDFDYTARPAARLEIPISVRLAEARANRKPRPAHGPRTSQGPRTPNAPRGAQGPRPPQAQGQRQGQGQGPRAPHAHPPSPGGRTRGRRGQGR